MNQKEWKKSDKFPGKYEWYNKTRKLQKSLQYNNDPNATVIHHLRGTEEQQKYNDEHYELWGFNLDGTFEYEKYVIFVTKEQHTEIHKCSEETINKISTTLKKTLSTDEQKLRRSEAMRGKNNPMYGKPPANKGKHISSAHKRAISGANKGNHAFLGQHHSKESKLKISNANKGNNNGMFGSGEQYKEFKILFQTITWHSFLKIRKSNFLLLKAIIFIYIKYLGHVDKSVYGL